MFIGHSVADASGHILAMDDKACDLMGRKSSEVVGLSYVDITHPSDQIGNIARIDTLLPTDAPISIRKRYLRPNGSSVELDVHVSRLETGKDTGRLVGTLMLPPPRRLSINPLNLWQTASKCRQFGEIRRAAIGDDLNGDHAWTIMIHAYLAEAEGRTVEIGAIAHSMRLSASQARRWIKALQANDLMELGSVDQQEVQLSARGLSALESVLGSVDNIRP